MYEVEVAVGAFSATSENLSLESQEACFMNDGCLITLG